MITPAHVTSDEHSSSSLSRRHVLALGAVGAATLALPRLGMAQSAPADQIGEAAQGFLEASPNTVTSPYALVDRITFGINAQEMALFDKLGWAKYLEYHLASNLISDTYVNSWLLEYPGIQATPYQALKFYSHANGFDVMGDLGQSQIVRQTFSNRQLLEVMTEFWLDHFNTYSPSIWKELLPYFVKTIRANALGNFTTMLNAVVRSGAMLYYLNNISNDRSNHNENFARELLELHTLGAYQGYTEADIYVARRCLTGWNFVGFYQQPWASTTNTSWGLFQFYPDHHDNEGGVFMGTLIPKGDIEQGMTILSMIANHPNTAKNICGKLIRKFVTETPSQAFVDAASNVFVSTSGDIKSVLRFILGQANFQANATPKFKRPLNYAVSALRATNAYLLDASDIMYSVLLPLGQLAFNWGPPNGYPDEYLKWCDNLLPRWRYAINLCTEAMWGARMDPFPYMTSRTQAGVVDYINKTFFGGNLPLERQTALKSFLAVANPTNSRILQAMGLALTLPEFQWH